MLGVYPLDSEGQLDCLYPYLSSEQTYSHHTAIGDSGGGPYNIG